MQLVPVSLISIWASYANIDTIIIGGSNGKGGCPLLVQYHPKSIWEILDQKYEKGHCQVGHSQELTVYVPCCYTNFTYIINLLKINSPPVTDIRSTRVGAPTNIDRISRINSVYGVLCKFTVLMCMFFVWWNLWCNSISCDVRSKWNYNTWKTLLDLIGSYACWYEAN